jgi:hypothetical protein
MVLKLLRKAENYSFPGTFLGVSPKATTNHQPQKLTMVNASANYFCMTILSTTMTTSTQYDHSEEDTTKSSGMQVAGDDVDDDEILCPLFMEGLPTDFGTNPQLAAIASLLEDDDDEDEDSNRKTIKQQAPQAGKVGGGKIRSKSRYQRQTSPYPKPPQSNNKPKKATMGEAQLFLKLWKL